MSTNHRERLERVVDKALKESAMGQPYGFSISGPSIWPIMGPDGKPTGQSAPAWFVVVTIRATGLGEPDIGNGFTVFGIMPQDEHFVAVAKGLLDRCLQERAQQDAKAVIPSLEEMKAAMKK